jgi:hypothetical protein
MAKIAPYTDLKISYSKGKPIRITQDGNVTKMTDMRLFAHNELWGTKHTYPKKFTELDKMYAMDILGFGECKEKPKKYVISWIDKILKDRANAT